MPDRYRDREFKRSIFIDKALSVIYTFFLVCVVDRQKVDKAPLKRLVVSRP